jgi:NADPH:quinone reductase-like Zn-dependent oxidoreductase
MFAISQRAFGAPDVLELTTIERPTPIPSEVLIRIHATAINPVDAMVRSGAFPLIGPPPFILGWDMAGVVEEVVPGVNRFEVGDRVFGMPFFPRAAGTYAEYIAVPSRQLARIPAGLDDVHAAALPMAALSAWQGLHDSAHLQAGERVLIHGGAGGVGHLAIQIAKAHGAEVITTTSRPKHDFVRDLGADHVVDYRSVDFAETVRGIDTVFDTVGGAYGHRSLQTLRPGGRLVTIVDRADVELRTATVAAGMQFIGVTVEPDYPALEEIARLVEAGQLRVRVDHELELAEAAKAHELIESGRTQGKIVLTI